MVLRFLKLPIVACACLIAGVCIGVTLSPVIAQQVAQQMAPPDGQVALRSDGAIYLIANGQRRWIAPVVISDNEINAYPEGEPIFSGVTALPPQPAPAPPPPPSPAPAPAAPPVQPAPAAPVPPAPVNPAPNTQPANPGADPAAIPPSANLVPAPPPPAAPPAPPAQPAPAPPPAVPQSAPPPAAPAAPAPTAVATPTGAVGDMDPLLPIEVDISGTTTFERGDVIRVVTKTKAGASCEMNVKWPDGNLADEAPQIADTRGRCAYSIKIPSNTVIGLGTITGTVREGGRTSTQTVEYQVVTNVS